MPEIEAEIESWALDVRSSGATVSLAWSEMPALPIGAGRPGAQAMQVATPSGIGTDASGTAALRSEKSRPAAASPIVIGLRAGNLSPFGRVGALALRRGRAA
jgi:hypothetical protein